MKKDFKTGMLLGLILVAAAMLWFCTREGFSIKPVLHSNTKDESEINRSEKMPVNKQPAEKQVRYKAILPDLFASKENTTIRRTDSRTSVKKNRQLQRKTQSPARSAEQSEKIKTPKIQFHSVAKGETLSSIAYQYYGSSNKWPRILEANRSRIKNPDKIREGIRLIIPQ